MAKIGDINIGLDYEVWKLFNATRVRVCQAHDCENFRDGCTLKEIGINQVGGCDSYKHEFVELKDDEHI